VSKPKKQRNPQITPYDKLYHAVAEYVESKGGAVIVAGGIQIQEWPSDGPYQFTVAVKCTGRKPKFAEAPDEQI